MSAKDLASGKVQKIRIEAQSGLNEEEIKRMVRDAELHADEDKARKEEVEIRNEADTLAFRAQKSLDEYKDKIPQEVSSEVSGKIDAIKKALEGDDISRIRATKEDLERSMQHIGEAMSKAGGPSGPTEPEGQQQKSNNPDDIEEAEVEIIDDNKP